MVDKNLGPHEIGDDNRDDHGVILVDGIDAFEVFVSECYGKEASR